VPLQAFAYGGETSLDLVSNPGDFGFSAPNQAPLVPGA
jgi:hypothetical protein